MELCCFGTQALTWMEAHDKLAGWAQFFGAMLAIGASYLFAAAEGRRSSKELAAQRAQHEEIIRREDRDTYEYVLAYLTTATVLTEHAWMVIDENAKSLVGLKEHRLQNMARHSMHDVASVSRQLMDFPIHELPTSEAIQAFALVRTASSSVERMFEVITRTELELDFGGEDAEIFAEHKSGYMDALAVFAKCMEVLKAERIT